MTLLAISFLAGVPLGIGLLVGFMARRNRSRGLAGAGTLSVAAILLYVFTAGAVLREGVICIVMAMPLFIVLAIIGGVLGAIFNSSGGTHGPKVLSIALFAPLLAAPMEEEIVSPVLRQATVRSVHIAASPEVVWRHINFPTDIRPEELENGLAYRIGVPYPIEGRTLEGRVGGKRTLRWQRGVQFDEVITDWQPQRLVAWTYSFGPDSFPQGSLDDHIVIGGRYFNLETTSYTLAPEGGGTRLTVNVGSTVTTNFNWYAGWWARRLVEDTAETILGFYKARAERS